MAPSGSDGLGSQAGAPTPPDKRHSVLGRQRGSVESASDFGISLSFHQAVNGRTADVFAKSLLAPFLEGRDGLVEIQGDMATPRMFTLAT
jgi:hypothetical protein